MPQCRFEQKVGFAKKSRADLFYVMGWGGLNIIHAISVFLHVRSVADYFILQDRIIYNLNKHEKYRICFVVRVGRG